MDEKEMTTVENASETESAVAEVAVEPEKKLKLNYPQTIKVGFAFAIIMIFWTMYDFVVPLLLETHSAYQTRFVVLLWVLTTFSVCSCSLCSENFPIRRTANL